MLSEIIQSRKDTYCVAERNGLRVVEGWVEGGRTSEGSLAESIKSYSTYVATCACQGSYCNSASRGAWQQQEQL